GIRDKLVTGVQTCALPISNFEMAQNIGKAAAMVGMHVSKEDGVEPPHAAIEKQRNNVRVSAAGIDEHRVFRRANENRIALADVEIGRASCRERGERWVGAA